MEPGKRLFTIASLLLFLWPNGGVKTWANSSMLKRLPQTSEELTYPSSSFGDEKKKKRRGLASEKKTRIPSSDHGVQKRSIIVNELGFFPDTVYVNQGNQVHLFITSAQSTGNSRGVASDTHKPLCFILDAFQVRKQIEAGKIEEVRFTPQKGGQIYHFNCPLIQESGKLIVREQ